MQWLKQSTAVTVKLGPFLDESDGKTAETGLTISQADVRLSKNGGNFAQKSSASACTHDESGWYDCALDATDTGTLGRLVVAVHESGALPVWREFVVVPANVWDSFFGSDLLQVDVHSIDDDEAAANNLESDYDGTGYAKANSTVGTVTDLTNANPSAADIADAVWDEASTGHVDAGSAGAQLWTDLDAIKAKTDNLPADPADDSDIDAQLATIDAVVDAIKAVTDNLPDGGALSDLATVLADTNELQTDWTDGGRLDLLLDAIKAVTDNLPDGGALSDLATVLADTSELQTDWTDGGRLDLLLDAIKAKTDNLPADPADDSDIDAQLATIDAVVDAIKAVTDSLNDPSAGEVADAVWDEVTAGHQAAGTAGKALTDGITAGSGAITFTYTLTSSVDGSGISDADVWVTSDLAGNNVLASGTTDASGQVTFYLDAGTVYVWRQKSGWNFTNPDAETVA